MSGVNLEFRTYDVFEVGKLIKSSKMKHVWRLSANKRALEIRALESLVSGKFRVMVQDRIIFDQKANETVKKSGVDLKFENLTFKIKKVNERRFDLIACGERFVPLTTRSKTGGEQAKGTPVTADEPSKTKKKETQASEASKPAFQEWMSKNDKFLDYDAKDDSDDDFNLENEQSQFRIDASEFNFNESKVQSAPVKETPSNFGFRKDMDVTAKPAPQVGIKLKKKDAPEIAQEFDDWNFDAGKEKKSKKEEKSDDFA